MLRVGLTGGIGSGKSSVGEILQELGAVVIDSDDLAKSVIERGTDGFEQVIAAFGDEILSSGEIDRSKLAAQVFNDEAKRRKLESIIHPLVRKAAEEQSKNLPDDAIVVNEIPLLFETNGASRFDFVISVSTKDELRVARLKQRGMKDYEIAQRIAAQATDQQRASISNAVIENNGSIDALAARVQKVWDEQLIPKLTDQAVK
ncbi:MAG: dephospho-CoA kinase [Candidatus Nanopelagicaceae bacterium]|nr:dephospho-CoA kinase [Candidatus Nanopelagicaceae bacterium]